MTHRGSTGKRPAGSGEAPPGRRPVIGFVAANIHVGVAQTLWRGVTEAAERHGVDLVCFPGGELQDAEEIPAGRNVLYDLVSPSCLDGLICWTSALGLHAGRKAAARYRRAFRALPVVSLTLPFGEHPTLVLDSYEGTREALAHLVEAHDRRRLAFLRGPASHGQAQQRYRAYRDALEQYVLPLEPALVSPPVDFDARDGASAMRVLLDTRALSPGRDFDAVVASSDVLATGALRVLSSRGVRVPVDVAVVSVNDSPEARLATPPLTSVAMPFQSQGEQAVAVLLARLRGEPDSRHTALSARLVIRQSCGCPPAPVVPDTTAGVPPDRALAAAVERLGGTTAAYESVARLRTALLRELDGARPGEFLRELERLVGTWATHADEVAAWEEVVIALRAATLPRLRTADRARAEFLHGQAHLLVAETARRLAEHERWQAEQTLRRVQEIGQAIVTAQDLPALADALAAGLSRVGIPGCYLSLYEGPAAAAGSARLVLAHDEQRRLPVGPEGVRFPARQLAPPGFLPRHRRHSLVAEPLLFGEEQIGFVLFEIGPRDGAVYETLGGQISSALHTMRLLRDVREARARAEWADRITTRLLADVSQELREPLTDILARTDALLDAATPGAAASSALVEDVRRIRRSAERQLALVDDLWDLSHAGGGTLDLVPELIDPRPVLAEAFSAAARRRPPAPGVDWRLRLPDRLPMIQADRARLRQIVLHLLGSAARDTRHVALGAEPAPPRLHIWVESTSGPVPAQVRRQIFEPFAAHPAGPTIAYRLARLHGGSVSLETRPGGVNVFHAHLPLPNLADQPVPVERADPVLWYVSAGRPAPEIVELSRREGLRLRRITPGDDLEALGTRPTALVWDLAAARPADWALVRRLGHDPWLRRTPFVLYPPHPGDVNGRTVRGSRLADVVDALRPAGAQGPVLVVDGDPEARIRYREVLAGGLPGHAVRTVGDGAAALALMTGETPSLVVLDLAEPEAFDVVDRMRADPVLRDVPVLALAGPALSPDDVRRLELHAGVVLQGKGILEETELARLAHRVMVRGEILPRHTSALVKRTLAYLHQHYHHQLTRRQIARAVGVSEDYLSRVFHRELDISPWEYLNRLRIQRAKERLRRTDDSIQVIAHRVGFRDRAYFSRVFRKLTGVTPQAFRERPEG